MRAWAQGTLRSSYQIPSETQWFAKLALALLIHEADEAVLNRQRPVWVRDLVQMSIAQAPDLAAKGSGITLPPGVRLVTDSSAAAPPSRPAAG